MRKITKIGLTCLTLLLMSSAAWAQDNNQPPPPSQQNRPEPATFRQQFIDNIKQQLGMNDQDFAAIQPEIEKIMQLQRDSQVRRLMGPPPGGPNGGPGGPGGFGPPPQSDQPQSDVQQKTSALLQVLDDTGASPLDIKTALDALRAAKTKAHDDLTKARQDLVQVLTPHQEAILVSMGLLE